jgi:hypothetical protein
VAGQAKAEYRVRAEVWLYPGAGGWHFANLSPRQSFEIKERFGSERPGFGAVPVRVTIGGTTWETSLFPDRKTGTYLFAIKAAVRKAEGITAGGRITAVVQVR